ncbi:urea ABC transporter permease subunit UrtB [Acinetobacter rathckeae]|uniref:urea ABC transporter permease subunit UrtB n=1 Tax=Acinetobacter rathckeae TaxID=2605272 RepID=UPI0018A25A65|nr:urea ABC transporter permease subunit UrtB [Acinetobacter rathckeae]MBF7695336.1 urea ABC transporter permease subunit UrtB [Acinetobacter rathckeae]
MSVKTSVATIFMLLAQLCCLQYVYAESTTNTSNGQQVISADDAIQKFVKANFSERRNMLNQWTASTEQLEKLADYLEKEQLYTDSAGHTYIMKSADEVFSYPQDQQVKPIPADLNQVTLVNTLQKALSFGLAKAKLKSDSTSQRLKAIDILESNVSELDPNMVNQLYAHESNDQVKNRFLLLKARMDLSSTDVKTKIQAADILKASNRPDVLADIDQQLSQTPLDAQLKQALEQAKKDIAWRLKMSEWSGYVFSGVSTASILLLAALGLAITYGLLGVINMAHGELIMIGAYTTYVVQGLFKTYLSHYMDWYLIAAIPAAFLVSALVGMLIERTVIRPLYGRQLETLLATFGVSLILMQLVRMIFGAQNVEISNISWLSGGWSITPSLILPYNRIAIIGFTVAILLLLLYVLNKTRFGLFIRAVTQNRQMARAVGIRSARIDMMAFGLGSGLAGLAGCALAQVGNVGPDLGQNYIIDAFLVVVVGGVGQVWGAVLAALGLGVSGTVLEIGLGAVLAKIILLVLVVLFIQKRPQGLFAIKGRFVE